jgi:tRNA threonylcarbamoyladenosine biosynthesis protein TsaE
MDAEPREMCIAAVTGSEDETRALAAQLAAELTGGEVLGLRGDLGAGKTVFVQGLARGLGASAPVTSPSFVIVHEYPGRLLLCHVDLYRLDMGDVNDLGLDDLITPDGVVAIEWSERLPPRLCGRLTLDIAIDFGAGECERAIRIGAAGAGAAARDLLRRACATLGEQAGGAGSGPPRQPPTGGGDRTATKAEQG